MQDRFNLADSTTVKVDLRHIAKLQRIVCEALSEFAEQRESADGTWLSCSAEHAIANLPSEDDTALDAVNTTVEA